MNQKKCPKCGESNPQEAVMCWACYTPLSGDGSSKAATAASRGPTAAAHLESAKDDKKKAVAPWQIGLIVGALLIAGGSIFMMTRGGTPEEMDEVTVGDPKPTGPSERRVTTPQIASVTSNAPPAQAQVPMPNRPTDQPSFRVTTGPSRNSSWATIGIVPTTNVTNEQAVALAQSARTQVTNGRNFQGVSVFVFTDASAARSFQTYQRQRGGAALGGNDYVALSQVWEKTLLRYEFSNGKENVRNPSQGGDWWSRAN